MTNHLLLIFFIAFLSSDISAQLPELIPLDNVTRKVSFGIIGSADYCNRTLQNSDGSEFADNSIRLRNEGEIAKTGYTIGLALHVPLGRNSNLRTGLSYSNKGFQRPWNRSLQWPGQTEPEISGIKSIYSDYFLDVPMTFEFYLNPEKQKWYVSTGIVINIFLKEIYTQVLEEKNGAKIRSTHKNEHDFNRVNFSPEVSIGRNFQVAEKVALRVAPVFRYGIFRTFDAPVSEYLWSAGLNMSCIFGN